MIDRDAVEQKVIRWIDEELAGYGYGGKRTEKNYFNTTEAFPQPVDDHELEARILRSLPGAYIGLVRRNS